MRAIGVSLVLLVVAAAVADEQPVVPKLPVGKDTTYVTGPLDKYGYIDYEAALNAELSKRTTAEKNANVLLILAFGPAPEGGDGLPEEYFKSLGIPMPPKNGDYFRGLNFFGRDQLGLTPEQINELYEVAIRVSEQPWGPKDSPQLVEWLKLNEKPLALVTEATKRPEYFNPLASRRKKGEPSNIVATLLPSVQKCRELALTFTVRAMFRLNEGKLDDAWTDLLTCHRLGRLVSHGATSIESLVGFAICQIATDSTLAYLDSADLTANQLQAKFKELRALLTLAPMADKLDFGERIMFLDALQQARRGGIDAQREAGLREGDTIEWEPAMRFINKECDRMVAATRIKGRAERVKELSNLMKEWTKAVNDAEVAAERAKKLRDPDRGKAIGNRIGSTLFALLATSLRRVIDAHDRAEQAATNLQVAFALAAYRKDSGRYPATLADLAPKYLATVPDDIFSGKPLIYKPNDKGYLLYSVGVNGKDDGGQERNDDPPGDYLAVRMPLPERKSKK